MSAGLRLKCAGGLWLASTVLWASTPALGAWLTRTAWLLVIVAVVLVVLLALARVERRKPVAEAVAAALIVTLAGPITIAILRAIGSHL